MLVIDANVAVAACAKEDGFTELGDELSAPPLMWSEARANVALAQTLGCRLVTIDARLRRGAAQLGIVIGLHELLAERKTPEPEPQAEPDP
jgi:predicted nucleic acid-binding protein